MKVMVKYFGQLKDLTGKEEESIETDALTVDELIDQLQKKYREFEKLKNAIRVAREDEILSASSPIRDGDTLALLPPVSGG